ncbi:MAG: glycosyltransferase family 9 protein [Planctomycetes bacterium]|nr:glycosyltransferase family 9 protein [Planctomycetota bacterium]
MKIRKQRFCAMVYLAPSTRQAHQVCRDLRFFRWAGIKSFYGAEGFTPYPKHIKGEPLPMVAHETDQLLARLKLSGIAVPPDDQVRFELNLNDQEELAINKWQRELPSDEDRMWVAIGPGSKMAVKRWPGDRYSRVVQDLIDEYNIWPVVFGGPEDQALGEALVQKWRLGYVAAGALNIRESIAALSKCGFYLGNDTGTMHMAVAAGLKCVAIFSAREYPGNWYPYGSGHKILRAEVPCENCILEECLEHNNKCINSIEIEQVFQACEELMPAKQPVKLCVE